MKMKDWNLSATRKGLRPLAVDASGILCYSQGVICRVGYDLKNLELICELPPVNVKDHFARKFRLVDRVFRLAPNHAILVGSDLFISRGSEIWLCDLTTGALTLDFVIPNRRRALELGRIDLPNGDIKIVFGEYFYNPARLPVNVWGRAIRDSGWSAVHGFATGEIDHVHSVTAIGDEIFVLCGDFDMAASIWLTDRHFSKMRPLVRGTQACRSAWIAELGGRIYSATDTQLEANHIYELRIEESVAHTRILASIEGSSIYSAQGVEARYFSTTVECGMPTGNFIRDVFETRRGPGIRSSNAKIMSLNMNGVSEEIFSAPKDSLPFRLAQFGTFIFPSGQLPANTIVAYGNALTGVDDTCLVFLR